ncbi:putative serine/threonine-protein kinase roco6 [Stylophora pistillata]|uniref:Putative serine/threonine-protein kinase roco6 n=1 Tax=Stylophora pistillata TaxID=50429 RepID=A0A2B4R5H4_STYPI|nr:putative serine/threonine-protein kinase roco6 [Stylophora pistillata]
MCRLLRGLEKKSLLIPQEDTESPENALRVYSDVPDHVDRQRAQLAYEAALKDGYVQVYRGRIILVGQDRTGKTSLKKSLLGLPFDPKQQSTKGIEVDPSKCEIDVDQAVKNWQLTRESKPGLLECSKDLAKIVVGRMCGADISQFLKEETTEEGELELEDEVEDVFKSKQVEEDEGFTDILQNSGNEHSTECKVENMQAEPDVMIDVSQPPDTEEHVYQWLEYAQGKPFKSALLTEEPYVTMDVWDFAGQHLYYASHPIFLSQRALYILVHNLSKPLDDPAEPCVRQGRQHLYYASHPIFLSQRALYILVHNLSKPLDAPAEPCIRQGSNDVKLENPNNETNMENLLSWLATVHSVALATDDTDDDAQHKLPYLRPPVFIVGTHADKPVKDIAAIKKQIKERISGMEYERHVVRPLFCIDNTRSQQLNFIKKFIQKIRKQRKKHKKCKMFAFMLYPLLYVS